MTALDKVHFNEYGDYLVGEYSDSLSFSNSKIDHDEIASIFAQPTHLLIVMKSDAPPSNEFPKMFPSTITTIVLDVDGTRYEYSAKEVLALLDWWMEHRDDQYMPGRRVARDGQDGMVWHVERDERGG